MKEPLKDVGLLHVEATLPALLQQAQSQQLTYEAFLQQVLSTEREARQQMAYQRRFRLARLPASKTLEAFDFSFQPGLSARLVHELAHALVSGDLDQCDVAGTARSGENALGQCAGGQGRSSWSFSLVYHTLTPGRGHCGGS